MWLLGAVANTETVSCLVVTLATVARIAHVLFRGTRMRPGADDVVDATLAVVSIRCSGTLGLMVTSVSRSKVNGVRVYQRICPGSTSTFLGYR